MPFTFAHPAAALPLSKYLGRFGSPSALVIGSMAPDLVYFVPLGIHGRVSHSIPALFWFCLPAGLLVYAVFMRWLRQPFCALLPDSVQRRIVPLAKTSTGKAWLAVAVSLVIGAVTHLIWDSFTHANSPWSSLRSLLDYELFAVGSYQVFVFRVLQHGGGLFGLSCLIWWCIRWYRSSEARHPIARVLPTKRIIYGSFALVSVLAALVATAAGLSVVGSKVGMLALQYFTVKAIVTAVPVYVCAFLGYCVWWHMKNGAAT
jgi:Domain of unknown function (DUF4184)